MDKTLNEIIANAQRLASVNQKTAIVGRLWHNKKRSSLGIRFDERDQNLPAGPVVARELRPLEDGSRWEPVYIVKPAV